LSEEHEKHSAWKVRKSEALIVILLILGYINFRFINHNEILMIILGLTLGVWLAFRPSEWAVEGLENTAAYMGLSAYMVGVISSLASNTPEAVISGLTAVRGFTTGNAAMLDIAVISVLTAVGFNIMILGIMIAITIKKYGKVKIHKDVIEKDSELMTWTFIVLLIIFSLGVMEMIGSLRAGIPEEKFSLSPWISAILVISYITYIIFVYQGQEEKGIAKPHFSKRLGYTLAIAGFAGIFMGGEIITSSIETMLESIDLSQYGNPVILISLIIGLAGTVPEHGIAITAAHKGKVDISIGNLMGGILQVILLVLGGIGMFVPIPLDKYVMFQLMVSGGVILFLKSTIVDDGHLDAFEGIMMIILQLVVFITMIIE